MSVSFVCSCGVRFVVKDQLAGKLVQCKHCGCRLRIPSPSAPGPEVDIYGLDAPPPAPAPRPAPAGDALGPRTARESARRPESRAAMALRGFLDSLPRGEHLPYLGVGVAILIATPVLAAVRGLAAQVFFVFVIIAAFACSLWACASALSAAWRQGVVSAVTLSPALVATAVFYHTLIAPNPTASGRLAASVLAAVCYAGFFFREGRGKAYRRPVSLGMLATLLVVSISILLHVARPNIAGGITPRSLEQAASADPSSASGRSDPVARALERKGTLTEARSGFRPRPVRQAATREPLDVPPPDVFETVRYDSPAGPLAAYLSPDPRDGRKHPAIVWITGGDCNSIGDVWSPRDPANDQSAAAYREAGIVMMFPSLRGGNENPGRKEAFLGEVDDVLAAADLLARQDYVDTRRIYLGGHSTGGTLALLVAESTDRFRAVFSFGPVDDVRGYGPDYNPYDTSDLREVALRSPGFWLYSIRCPTFVFEGEQGNVAALRAMQRASSNPLVRFHPVRGADHFGVLGPTNRTIAAGILRDDGPATNLGFTPPELDRPFGR